MNSLILTEIAREQFGVELNRDEARRLMRRLSRIADKQVARGMDPDEAVDIAIKSIERTLGVMAEVADDIDLTGVEAKLDRAPVPASPPDRFAAVTLRDRIHLRWLEIKCRIELAWPIRKCVRCRSWFRRRHSPEFACAKVFYCSLDCCDAAMVEIKEALDRCN